MIIIRCDEASIPASQYPDAVWVPKDETLYYYNVDSCMTVTLIFENGLAGGHAGMMNPVTRENVPAENLQGVIDRIIAATANVENIGKLKRIEWIGNEHSADLYDGWQIEKALEKINQNYHSKLTDDDVQDVKPSDIVFTAFNEARYYSDHVRDQTAREVVRKELWEKQKRYLEENLIAEADKIEKLSQIRADNELENASEEIRTNTEKLHTADISQMNLNDTLTFVRDIKNSLGDINNQIAEAITEEDNTLSKDIKKFLQDTNLTIEANNAEINTYDDRMEHLNEWPEA